MSCRQISWTCDGLVNVDIIHRCGKLPCPVIVTSHNGPIFQIPQCIKYPTMHNFVTEMCTHTHISFTKWCIFWGYGTGALRDLCDRYIAIGQTASILQLIDFLSIGPEWKNLIVQPSNLAALMLDNQREIMMVYNMLQNGLSAHGQWSCFTWWVTVR